MRMLVRFVLGLVVLKAVVSSPRPPRQAELDTYDSANYDVDLENLNGENYDYDDGLTIDEPQIEIGRLAPPDYNYPEPGASLEEGEEGEEEEAEEEEAEEEEVVEEEEEEEVYVEEVEEVEQELPNIPQVIPPRGSEGSGILMGPATQKEEELRLTPIDILHISGDFGGSVGSGASSGASGGSAGGSGGSGDLLASGSGSSGELLGSGGSGDLGSGSSGAFSGDLGSGASGASGDLGSGGSGISGDFSSGTSGDLGSGVSGASGDLGSGASGASGDLLVASGISGDFSGSASGGSGGSGIILLPGEEELPLIPDVTPQEASGASGESGASGFSGASGSGASGESGVSGEESGEPEVPLVPGLIPGEEELLPTTPETPQEVEGEGSTESGDVDVDPDVDVDVDRTGMATCLLCTCLGGSVYCDDLKLDTVPPLPKETTHFYARYNKITKIRKSDFAQMNKLQRIDVTANEISSIEDNAFSGLPALKELVIRENGVAQLPALPTSMTLVDASHNNIGATGIHKEAFKDMSGLLYLYLTDNHIDHIPVPLPDSLRSLHLQRNNIQMMHEDTFCNLKDFNYIRNALEDIRLDGNPINLSRTPQAYVCLPRVPIGDLI